MTIHTHRVKGGIRRNNQKQKLTEKDQINSLLLQRQPDVAVKPLMDDLMMDNLQLSVKISRLPIRDNQRTGSIKTGHAFAKAVACAISITSPTR